MPLVPKFKSAKFGKRSLSYEGASLGNSFKLSEFLGDFKCQMLK